MNEEKWKQVKELFHQAQALPVEDRVEFLDKACAGDATVRAKVNDLLGSYESGFLEDPILHEVVEIVGAENNFQEGQAIGRYRLKELIGIGGMGEVFLADDTELKRSVAFKVLHEEVAGDKERVRRFIQEARAASALNHPNILTIHEIGTFENSRFIVSEYVNGETLRERLKPGALSTKESIEIAEQIAAALQAAHEAGIVHRDVKPENIMLRKDGLVKVLDFGLAKLSEPGAVATGSGARSASLTTAPGIVMGTVAYMSPEQARGVSVDARTDLWSLGVVLYEMLSGNLPFPGDTTSDIIASILKTEANALKISESKMPRDLETICFKALAKNVAKRYQTAQELLKDLQQAKKYLENATVQFPDKQFDYAGDQNTKLIRLRPTLSKEYIVNSVKRHKFLSATLLGVLILSIGVGTSLSWFGMADVEAPVSTSVNLTVTRLTTSGLERWAAISPDGKYLAHFVASADGSKGSLMLRQIATDNDRALIQGDFGIRTLVFSPDGNHIYYVKSVGRKTSLFRIPALGGEEFQVSENFRQTPIDISPDGDHIVYSSRNPNNEWELKVSSIRALISQTDAPITITPSGASFAYAGPYGGPAFSPDGKSVSIPSLNASTKKKKLVVFDISGKPPLTINSEFSDIGSAVWLSNSDLLITARRTDADLNMQMWQLGLDGSLRQLTSELTNYLSLSITADRSTMVATQWRTDSNVYLASPATTAAAVEASSFKQATRQSEVQFGALGMSWTRDSRLIYWYLGLDRPQLRIMNSDGSNNREFTNEKVRNPESPLVTPDGKYLLFNAVNDSEERYLWRMDLASGSIKALAYAGPWAWYPGFSVTSDSKSVIYTFVDPNWKTIPQDKLTGGLRRISIEGGEPTDVRVGDETFPMPQISPDGKLLGIMNQYGQIGIISMSNLKAAPKYFDTSAAEPDMGDRFLRWEPDGRSMIYIASRPGDVGGENLRRLPIDGSTPTNLTNFADGQSIFSFAYSADGKKLAVARGLITTDVVLAKNVR